MARKSRRKLKAPVRPIATFRLRSSQRPHYWKVCLWEDLETMHKVFKMEPKVLAFCQTEWYANKSGKLTPVPKLGEIHFASASWSINTVAHEVQHAICHRMRLLYPSPDKFIPDTPRRRGPDPEEVIAYESGEWVEELVMWLAENDPNSPIDRDVSGVDRAGIMSVTADTLGPETPPMSYVLALLFLAFVVAIAMSVQRTTRLKPVPAPNTIEWNVKMVEFGDSRFRIDDRDDWFPYYTAEGFTDAGAVARDYVNLLIAWDELADPDGETVRYRVLVQCPEGHVQTFYVFDDGSNVTVEPVPLA